MNERKIKKAKQTIKKFSKKYGLKYNSKWFRCIFLPYKESLIKKFLSGSPLIGYGFDKREKRFKNLNRFIKSELFKTMNKGKRNHANIISFNDFEREKNEINRIKEFKLREKVRSIYGKIEKKFKAKYLVILPKSGSYNLQILTHEWMHILLNKNKVKKKGRGYDWFNEGLATLTEYLVSNKTNKLKDDVKNIKVRHMYLKYALKWKEKLKKSKKRKGVIEKTFKTRKF